MKQMSIIPTERVENRIFLIRRKKVMFDMDLAMLYGIQTKVLKQQVRRNLDRFPVDFMFQLNEKEFKIWRSQIVTSSHGGNKYRPFVFTEQGIAMLSSVLRSKKAINVNIQIMRTFVRLREIISTHKELREKIESIEKKYDVKFRIIFEVINKLLLQEENKVKKEMGFRV